MKSIIFVIGLALAKWDLNQESVVVYWGQNSYGATHPDQSYKLKLSSLCQDKTIDVINISFLTDLTSEPPMINLSHHCGSYFPDTSVLSCADIGKEIKQCQEGGKTVILSIGGANAKTTLASKEAAEKASNNVWNMFLGGKGRLRPFGDAILDGIDLDIEGGGHDNYDHFLKDLRQKFNADKKQYFVTAAPQCFFPDANLQKIMEENPVDAIFIQFYNNWCGVHSFNNKDAWNWNVWEDWATNASENKKVKLFLGIPSTNEAADYGYVPPQEVVKVISDIKKNSTHFGGVMLWDASQNSKSGAKGKRMSDIIKNNLGIPSERATPEPRIDTPNLNDGSIVPHLPSSKCPKKRNSSLSTNYPVEGAPCHKLHACAGTQFATCNHGKWILRPCPEAHHCYQKDELVYCNLKTSN